MKIPLFITAAVIALFASSCRTSTSIDPNTGKPSTRCLPGSPSTYQVEPTK